MSDDYIQFEVIPDDDIVPVIAIARNPNGGYEIQSLIDDPEDVAHLLIGLGEDIIEKMKHGRYA